MRLLKTKGWLVANVKDLWLTLATHIDRILKLSYRIDKQTDRMDSLENKLQAQGEMLGRLNTDFNITDGEFDKMRMKVIQLDKASGGLWKTASGYVMRIRDMSTDHLKRCLAGNFGSALARNNMEREMKRRDEEARWRSKPMPGETVADVLTKVALASDGFVYNNGPDPKIEPEEEEEFVGRIDGTPVYVDANIGAIQKQRVRHFIARGHTARVL